MNKISNTRFAPTPSGYLHLGNICNLLLIYCISKQENFKLQLRIDDIDRSRFRQEYLDNIFFVTENLGICFDLGPSSSAEFLRDFSQGNKIDFYRSYLDQFNTFFCECTRADLQGLNGIYPGKCLSKKLGKNSSANMKERIIVDSKSKILHSLEIKEVDYNALDCIGYFILWNYLEDRPSYQLVSFVEDQKASVDFIIRGMDLTLSTFSQEFLFFKSGDSKLRNYLHHPLITFQGEKMSKSVLKNSQGNILEKYSKEELYSFFFKWFFGKEKKIESLDELVKIFMAENRTLSWESVLIE